MIPLQAHLLQVYTSIYLLLLRYYGVAANKLAVNLSLEQMYPLSCAVASAVAAGGAPPVETEVKCTKTELWSCDTPVVNHVGLLNVPS